MKNFHFKNLIWFFGFLVLLSCSPDDNAIENNPVNEPANPSAPSSISLAKSIFYDINLNDRTGDSFKVQVFLEGLTDANAVFQFAVTAPGTYAPLNFGNYVNNFKAYDENYKSLSVSKISTNQWRLNEPSKTAIIEYDIRETWDEPNPVDFIYKMGGTSIENDHSLINTFAVLGYPTGLKEKEYIVSIERPSNWQVGTALYEDSNGYFVAEDYDQLADSPILLGDLTNATINIDQTKIDIWTYSQTGGYTSSGIKYEIKEVMNDEKAFLKEIPVDHYTFLFHFEGSKTSGALEHSYSSVHVIEEARAEILTRWIKYASAHEFFHILTPLNVHSEVIDDFNFVTPTPSKHLWLYEGVTEWAAWLMRYRNKSIETFELLAELQNKIALNESYYDKSYSLLDISMKSYTAEGAPQYGNIYQRGAIVATMLDIRLLELSNGERGLREVLLELAKQYGPENAFQDDRFFDIFVDMTYPEIGNFIENYIKGTTELPYQEYFNKIGIQYDQNYQTLYTIDEPTPEQLFLFEKWRSNL